MVNIDNTLSASELKETATTLKICINEATRGTDELNEMAVAEMAALCLMQLGY